MYSTQINLSDGSKEQFTTTDEPEATPENGMVRIVFFEEKRKTVLIRTDLIISISISEKEAVEEVTPIPTES